MGMQLFGANYVSENFDGRELRWHFGDFLHSFMIVFRVLAIQAGEKNCRKLADASSPRKNATSSRPLRILSPRNPNKMNLCRKQGAPFLWLCSGSCAVNGSSPRGSWIAYAVRWVDRVHVGLHPLHRIHLHPVLSAHHDHRQSRRKFSSDYNK